MRAVWRVAQRAVRRRRLQTFVIGLVVLFSTASIVVALALLAALSAPFDRAFAATRGAHVVASFDLGRVSLDQLAGAGGTAGPYATTTVDLPESVLAPGVRPGPITVAGRDDPGGPADELDLWWGRWPTGDGEIVLNAMPPANPDFEPAIGGTISHGGRSLTIVGLAYSVSHSAGGWVTTAQMAAFEPTGAQVLYRWTGDVSTQAALDSRVAAATAGLPAGALADAQSYLVLRTTAASGPGRYLPFLAIFGVLGLAVAVLIVTNVVSGAVVSGFRHIGVLKSLGFTPRQVVAVYLLMAGLPALAGVLPGVAVGYPLAEAMLDDAFSGAGLGRVTVALWPVLVALFGMLAVVLLAALVPALRSHRIPAAEAISAGSAPRAGRALHTQRRLAGTRLPRSVSLGLGLPFSRPGRTALTAAAVVLGVTTVTFAAGVAASLGRFADARDNSESVQVEVLPGLEKFGEPKPQGNPAATRQMLTSLTGTTGVTAVTDVTVPVAGSTAPVRLQVFDGDYSALGYQDQLVRGHWLAGPGDTVVTSAFLRGRGADLGDTVTLQRDGRRAELTIVGEVMGDDPDEAYAEWAAVQPLTPGAPFGGDLVRYLVRLAPATDVEAYLAAVRQADPGLMPVDNSRGANEFIVTVVSISVVLTVMLSIVAALGVFQTVVLNTHERRRDLGMLKSIGMTPRQVTAMMVTSMAMLGALGGLLGIAVGMVAHKVSVPLVAAAAGTDIPASMMTVWQWPVLLPLLGSGLAIAVLGALLPARSAGRLPVAAALRSE
ncbi:ABC transporter permease [Paractinoplanes rishiriensis]|uniref:ABC3 transporter permease C-terminal domain-containing protein n=1 Tax=Paractinoplanes rishiriensis TaxID=1050105 RepID=A0A919K218_9ACTN|nr:ABC transporter permease [Actinoplanes rishiriensis]GIE95171.1 hypothetical protein Ari01nite_26360 [Actinoplanes rishiriensis]